MDKLRNLFSESFNFRTEYFEIPTERWETALHKKLADFSYEYDSPEDLAITHYSGHVGERRKTKELNLA